MVHFKLNRPEPRPQARPVRSPRRRVLVGGMFQTLAGTCQVSIKNLSCTGALIESPLALRVGVEGVLQADGLDCLCRVVWTDGRAYGLQFDKPLHTNAVLALHHITEADLMRTQSAAAREWFESQAR